MGAVAQAGAAAADGAAPAAVPQGARPLRRPPADRGLRRRRPGPAPGREVEPARHQRAAGLRRHRGFAGDQLSRPDRRPLRLGGPPASRRGGAHHRRRRNPGTRRQRHPGLLERPGADRGGVRRRLVQDRRHGVPGRGRLPAHPRPHQGDDRSGQRPERVPRGYRGGAEERSGGDRRHGGGAAPGTGHAGARGVPAGRAAAGIRHRRARQSGAGRAPAGPRLYHLARGGFSPAPTR